MSKRIITKPINCLLGAIIDRVSWDIFEFTPKAEASRPLPLPLRRTLSTTTRDASAPLVILGNGDFRRATYNGKDWFDYDD